MLTLQFVPYGEIEHLNIGERIDKLLRIVKKDRVVLMQRRLHPEEETQLIQETMTQIHEGFKGIEICTIFPEEKDLQLFKRLKKEMMKAIVGNRDGMTIIGPASIVKEIKRDPNKIMLLTNTKAPSKIAKSRSVKKTTRKKTTRRRR